MRCRNLLSTFFVGLLIFPSGCASDRNYRKIASLERTQVARYLELDAQPSIATIHFPRGTYSLEAEDDTGYYYRAPWRLIKHSFDGVDPYDGGIFVAKGARLRLRGYIIWAGGRSKIGNLSRAKFQFRN